MNQKSLSTVRQAAESCGVPIGWLKAEAEAGRVPYLRVGRSMLFNVEALASALERLAAGEQPIPSAKKTERQVRRG